MIVCFPVLANTFASVRIPVPVIVAVEPFVPVVTMPPVIPAEAEKVKSSITVADP